MTLTAERLRQLLDYDQLTGIFTWRLRRGGRANAAGLVAGAMSSDGYVKIGVEGSRYQAHRLAWLYVHGAWPPDQIDHINGVRSDNRLANLRGATNSENQQNVTVRRTNRLGLLGVTYHKETGKYRARLKVAGQVHDLGLHATPELAHAAYLRGKTKLHTFQQLPRQKLEAAA